MYSSLSYLAMSDMILKSSPSGVCTSTKYLSRIWARDLVSVAINFLRFLSIIFQAFLMWCTPRKIKLRTNIDNDILIGKFANYSQRKRRYFGMYYLYKMVSSASLSISLAISASAYRMLSNNHWFTTGFLCGTNA